MPLFNAECTLFVLDDKRVARSINEFQIREMYGAMRAFLKACVPKIPVRTGFLRSAFKPMRQFFGGGQEGADLNPSLAALFNLDPKTAKEHIEHMQNTNSKGGKLNEAGKAARRRILDQEIRKGLLRMRRRKVKGLPKDTRHVEWYYTQIGKKPAVRVVKNQANALKFVTPKDPGDVISGKGLTTEIQFDIQISYYRINDNFSRITGAPWRSMDAGFQAMLNYLERAARRYPYLAEVLVTIKMALKGSKVVKGQGFKGYDAATYRRRFGSSFFPTSGNIIPENEIAQFTVTPDNFGNGWPGLA